LQTKNAAILSHRPKTQQSLKDKNGPNRLMQKISTCCSLFQNYYMQPTSHTHTTIYTILTLLLQIFHPQYYPTDFSPSFLSKLQFESIAQLPTIQGEFPT
jgi:hypothetical protein